jgi:hypothetical protein
MSKPDYGLREAILLPWYNTLADQYLLTPYGTWGGNATLLSHYETSAYDAGESRHSRMVDAGRLWTFQHAHKNWSLVDM